MIEQNSEYANILLVARVMYGSQTTVPGAVHNVRLLLQE